MGIRVWRSEDAVLIHDGLGGSVELSSAEAEELAQKLRPQKQKQKRLTQAEKQEIARRYARGESATRLSEEYGTSASHLYQILKQQGISSRKPQIGVRMRMAPAITA